MGVSLSFKAILVTKAQDSYGASDEIQGPTAATLALTVGTNRCHQTAEQTRALWFSNLRPTLKYMLHR